MTGFLNVFSRLDSDLFLNHLTTVLSDVTRNPMARILTNTDDNSDCVMSFKIFEKPSGIPDPVSVSFSIQNYLSSFLENSTAEDPALSVGDMADVLALLIEYYYDELVSEGFEPSQELKTWLSACVSALVLESFKACFEKYLRPQSCYVITCRFFLKILLCTGLFDKTPDVELTRRVADSVLIKVRLSAEKKEGSVA